MSVFTFNVLKTSERSARLGRVTISNSLGQKVLDTPNCVLYTARGSVPHLTPDNLRALPFRALQFTLEHLLDEQPPASTKFMGGAHKFFNVQEYMLFFDARDPGNDRPEDAYMTYINEYCPDVLVSLVDHLTDCTPDVKRARRSVDRTLNWLDQVLERKRDGVHVFGVLAGHTCPEERKRSAEETSRRNVADDCTGFVLNAHALGESAKAKLDLSKVSIKYLPHEKPRLAYGLGSPQDILMGVLEGIDLFDTSYPSQKASNGCALTFTFGGDNVDASSSMQSMDLSNRIYADDAAPLMEKCECYACQHHSRAYIHHLLSTHEMLAGVLLTSHNLFQYANFFSMIRASIKNETLGGDVQEFLHL